MSLTLNITSEKATTYFKSKYIYLTAKSVAPFVADNKIILLEGQLCQFKLITSEVENYDAGLFHTKANLEIEVKSGHEEILLNGSKTVRFTAIKIVRYENNFGKTYSK